MTPITTVDREVIAGLLRRMPVAFEHERADHGGVIALAGYHGMIRPINGKLVLILKPDMPASLGPLRRQLISGGVLSLDGDALVFARLPEGAEVPVVMNLLGLKRAWSPQVSA